MKKILFLISVLLLTFSLSAKESTVPTKEIVLSADNTLTLADSFNGSSVAQLIQQASNLDSSLKSGYPIYLFLYTPGGSIQAGLELYDFLAGLNRPVHTITLFAASMGFQTVQHLGTRYITRYGVLMSHKARGGFQGEFGGGDSQLDARYGMWLRRINMLDGETVSRTNGKQTLKSYRDAYSSELWLNGKEAVEQGYADAVAVVKCDTSLRGSEEQVFSNGFFSVKAKISKCPLNTNPLSVGANIITNKGEMELEKFISEGGKFGSSCRRLDEEERKDYWSGNVVRGQKAELCAVDKTLTLEKIKEAISAKQKFISRDLRNHVEYSY